MKKSPRFDLDQLLVAPVETRKNAAEYLAEHFKGRVMNVIDSVKQAEDELDEDLKNRDEPILLIDADASDHEAKNNIDESLDDETMNITSDVDVQMKDIETLITREVARRQYWNETEFWEQEGDRIAGVFGQMYFRGRLDRVNDMAEGKFSPDSLAAFGAWKNYFIATLQATNAQKFRDNLTEIKGDIRENVENKKVNLYSEKEKKELFIDRLEDKYEDQKFKKRELKKIVEFAELTSLSDLPIHKIKIFDQASRVIQRYLKGEKTQFVALAAAMAIPAFMSGLAPKYLSDAFVGNKMDISKIGIFGALSATAIGLETVIDKLLSIFSLKNNSKKGGFDEQLAQDFVRLSPEKIQTIGNDALKQRVLWGKDAYDTLLSRLSQGVLPSAVALGTSIVVLLKMSPILAAATAGVTVVQIAADKLFRDKFDFWGKQRKAEKTVEASAEKLEQLLAGHMEMRLYGRDAEAEKIIQKSLKKSNEASEEKTMFQIYQNTFSKSKMLNRTFEESRLQKQWDS